MFPAGSSRFRSILSTPAALLIGCLAAGCAQSSRPVCRTADQCGPGFDCRNNLCVAVDDPDGGQNNTAPDGSTVIPPDGSAVDAEPQCDEFVFERTETAEHFVVPDNARYMHIKAWGAGGNQELACPYEDAGMGGYTEAVFEVTPGTELVVIVGKRGRAGLANEDIIRYGFGHHGGGGLSGVFLGPDMIDENSWDRAIIVAGGGGGASAPCAPGGCGNHPDAGGMPTMMAGEGGDGVNGSGGGYRGGNAVPRGVGGKGGSGFVSTTDMNGVSAALDSIILYSEPGDGVPPRTDDPDYANGAGGAEANGRVMIYFKCELPPVR